MNGRRRWGIWVVAGIGLVAIDVVAAIAGESTGGPVTSASLPHAARAPGFELPTAQGGTLRLADLASHVVCLVFMDLHALAEGAGDEPSRRQIDGLTLIQNRYAAWGVRTIIVDASALVVGPHRTMRRGESETEAIPILRDDAAGSTVARYGVTRLPTTVLIAADGRIVQRWEGVVPNAQLEGAVQRQLPNHLEATR